ncbi:oligomycin resistance ATP-dependent permease, putative [Candida dubliniensis CD36]|uniref:Oligomycin resistance ATP-dependent permease, putative n=1 Tax=Candida dubliniensis (strain CD36 / ATCC MYA-646 / CBS 7987 / NCPF 3949 / NRRL Y-17841) TaxID=573826 RepID=B9WCR3_CANDC|nr:oligomycin resistance ATP-dependent permease, putative [Candida dubliniensis CD36]CAX44186.1 oligomycin resistance ATP-dependent permease, putative [Candida dubliniensis CD36]
MGPPPPPPPPPNSDALENQELLQRQKRLLSFMLSKKVPPVPTEDERKPYPASSANIFSRMFFWWLSPVMKSGYKRTLQPDDLFYLTDDIKVQHMADTFYRYMTEDIAKAQQQHIIEKCKERGETLENSSVDSDTDLQDFKLSKFLTVWALAKTFKWQYTWACICLTLSNVGQTTLPLLSKKLIEYVELKALGHETGIGKGIGYSFGTAIIVFVIGVFINHFFYRSMITGAQAKAVLTKALLDKSFKLNAEAKHKYPLGKITSMLGTDLSRIDFALGFQPFLIVFPVPIGIAIAILIINIGPASLVGVGILFVFMIAIAFSTGKLFAYRKKANFYTDSRVNYIKEALTNLKVIKFYSWEPPYHENISNVRKKEMKIIYHMQVLRNIVTSFAMSLTLFASMTAFLVLYAIRTHGRDPASIFSSLSLYNTLTQQVFLLPMALASGADAFMGISRVGEFMSQGEIPKGENSIEATPEMKQLMEQEDLAIEVDHADFEWETFADEETPDEKKANSKEEKKKEEEENHVDVITSTHEVTSEKSYSKENGNSTIASSKDTEVEEEEVTFKGLKDIDIKVKKGEFIVITGLIGSGKSSLLNALSGFMKRTNGSVNVNGSLLLCGYPWVQNTTVKENIIFGSEWDEEKYNKVIYACSLEADLEILPAGDRTEIGERGITLSGGQKARINLARAVYANKDIILLDDVLSAVDARVGKHIMNNCILDLLKNKTRILATHQLSLIGSADRVIFLNPNGTIDVGKFEELQATNESFSKLMAYNSESKKENDEKEEEEEQEELQEENELFGDEDPLDDELEEERKMIQRQVTQRTQPDEKDEEDEEGRHREFNVDKTADGTLIEAEDRAVNAISLSVYKEYLVLGSGKFSPWVIVPILLTFIVLATFCQIFTNTWLSFWTAHKFNQPDKFYIGIYIMFAFLSFILLTLEFIVLVYITNTAAVMLNVMAVKKVLHAPMSFMDTTPMGRILNRFTKDTDVLDNEIGDQLRFFLFVFANIIGVLILCVIYLPWFAIAIPFLGFLFVSIANYYQASAREIKRLEAIQRSLVYNNFDETLSGMITIKAYHATERFALKNNYLIDRMNEAYYITIANQRWLAIHMDFVAALFALLIALLCVNRVFNISASSVGLIVSYVFQIAGQLSMLIRTYTQVENEMNSAERLHTYAQNLPKEAPYIITENTPPPNWPNKGAIEFDNASLAYRPGLPLVLKNLKFKINPMEKIGICGRTGAGKSSIMTALYRLSELESGKIIIDDIDISTLGLKDLRSKLSIIPQDPVLFRGSIRKNLDPFNEHSDDKLWDALRRTGLIEESRLDIVKKQIKPKIENNKKDDKKKEEEEEEEDDDDDDGVGSTLHKFHLDQTVEEEGSNFSLGERQLIAFARALVRDSRILILDEATSSVDYETDSKIQHTIIKEFKDCTILCIAHRLKTIINYDRILVLDKGEIKEFDTPWNLFNSENSIFQQMCHRSNITEQDFQEATGF